MQKLDWQVWPNVSLLHQNNSIAEYDVIGIRFYQLSAFECKRLNGGWDGGRSIRKALLSLYQIQQHFGGPFGKSYWIYSGRQKLTDVNIERIKEFRITLIRSSEINDIVRFPERLGLPTARPRD